MPNTGKKTKKDSSRGNDSPEQVSPEQALDRMKSFAQRKEKFVAAIKKSKD